MLRFLVVIEENEARIAEEHGDGSKPVTVFEDEILSWLDALDTVDCVDVFTLDPKPAQGAANWDRADELRVILRRLDRWKGAPDNGYEEEGYIDMVCDVANQLARMLNVKDRDRHADTGFDSDKDSDTIGGEPHRNLTLTASK